METNSQRERSQNCRLCWVPNTTHITLIPGNSHGLASRLLISSLDFTGILFLNHRKTLKMNCNSCVTIAAFNFSLKRKCSETYQTETEAVSFPFRKPIRSNSFFFCFFLTNKPARTFQLAGEQPMREVDGGSGGKKPLRLTP